VLDITDHWHAKAASVEAYQSQFVAGRSTEPPSFVEKLREEAAFWGKTIGVRYGEPFASKEPIGMKNFESLV
jgi:LmbE family N-acetylglucosaminyl deacetylase